MEAFLLAAEVAYQKESKAMEKISAGTSRPTIRINSETIEGFDPVKVSHALNRSERESFERRNPDAKLQQHESNGTRLKDIFAQLVRQDLAGAGFDGAVVLLDTQGIRLRGITDQKGIVHFLRIPCGKQATLRSHEFHHGAVDWKVQFDVSCEAKVVDVGAFGNLSGQQIRTGVNLSIQNGPAAIATATDRASKAVGESSSVVVNNFDQAVINAKMRASQLSYTQHEYPPNTAIDRAYRRCFEAVRKNAALSVMYKSVDGILDIYSETVCKCTLERLHFSEFNEYTAVEVLTLFDALYGGRRLPNGGSPNQRTTGSFLTICSNEAATIFE